MDFYNLAKEIHEENVRERRYEWDSPKGKEKWEMILFEIDCLIKNRDLTFENFLKYLGELKEEERPSAPLRKMIAENRFKKKFEYNLDLCKWELLN